MKYRKKPIEIEAVQITEGFLRDMRGPLGEHLVRVDGSVEFYKDHVKIATLEGVMHGNLGDWIITGVNGEKYPCKDDIFQKTYEKPEVEEQEPVRFDQLLKDPKVMGEMMTLAAHGGSFMQDFKMQIWGAMTHGNRVSESQLDNIAMNLYDKWVRKPGRAPRVKLER